MKRLLTTLVLLTTSINVTAAEYKDGWINIDKSAVLFAGGIPVIEVFCDDWEKKPSAVIYLQSQTSTFGVTSVKGADNVDIIGYSYNRNSITFNIAEIGQTMLAKLKDADYAVALSSGAVVQLQAFGFFETASIALDKCGADTKVLSAKDDRELWFKKL